MSQLRVSCSRLADAHYEVAIEREVERRWSRHALYRTCDIGDAATYGTMLANFMDVPFHNELLDLALGNVANR
jgi:hypothetical protein